MTTKSIMWYLVLTFAAICQPGNSRAEEDVGPQQGGYYTGTQIAAFKQATGTEDYYFKVPGQPYIDGYPVPTKRLIDRTDCRHIGTVTALNWMVIVTLQSTAGGQPVELTNDNVNPPLDPYEIVFPRLPDEKDIWRASWRVILHAEIEVLHAGQRRKLKFNTPSIWFYQMLWVGQRVGFRTTDKPGEVAGICLPPDYREARSEPLIGGVCQAYTTPLRFRTQMFAEAGEWWEALPGRNWVCRRTVRSLYPEAGGVCWLPDPECTPDNPPDSCVEPPYTPETSPLYENKNRTDAPLIECGQPLLAAMAEPGTEVLIGSELLLRRPSCAKGLCTELRGPEGNPIVLSEPVAEAIRFTENFEKPIKLGREPPKAPVIETKRSVRVLRNNIAIPPLRIEVVNQSELLAAKRTNRR